MAATLTEDREFLLENKSQVARCAAFLGAQVPPLRVIMSRVLERRTLEQNARLWKLHTLAGEVTGYSPGEMHEEALCKFFGFTEQQRADLFTGEIVTKRVPLKRSSMRNKKEFSAFMEATEAWYAQDFGVWLE